MDKLALLDQLSKLEALRSALHSSFRFWEWMVVVGLGFDLLVILKEYWDDLKSFWRREIHPPEKPSGVLLLLALLGTGLILYGISKELSVDGKLEKVETDTRQANSQLFGIVSNEADAVTAKAKDLEGRLIVASADVGSLEKRIASQGARWQLLEDNRAEFINDLKPFAPQRIIVVSCGLPGAEAIEANRLGQDLMNFLGKFDEGKNDGAGWVVESKDATLGDCLFATEDFGAGTPGDGGLVLVLSATQDFAAKHSATVSAKKLQDTLNKLMITTRTARDSRVGIALAVAEPNSFWKLVPEDPKAVFLLVGPNPLFTVTKPSSRPK